MARLFDEIFRENGSGDISLLVVSPSPEGDDLVGSEEDAVRLRCHSLILMQHLYFFKMLSMEVPLREAIAREVVIVEPKNEFLSLIRFIYTGHIDIARDNVARLLTLADKYCIDEVVDLSLKHIKENFDADMFFNFYNFTTLNSAYQEKLREQLMSTLRQRRNLCSITDDPRWAELPIELVEGILSQDDLPIASEAEVLALIAQWIGGQRRGKQDVARLLGALRISGNTWVRVSDIDALIRALGLDILSSKVPRNGSAVWDPSFTVHRHETAGPSQLGVASADANLEAGQRDCICHQLGPKDYLQQEPGWMYPGVHSCRVSLSCTSWSHRERRLLRSSPTQAAALQKRAFECGPPKSSSRDRSPSPPPAFQVRRAPRDAFETFDIAQMTDGAEQGVLGGGVIGNLWQDKVDHEIVDHQIICGVSSGHQRHGIRFSQREPNAIYTAEDLNGKHSLNIGGTASTVSFDLELVIGEASKCGISKCRFALQRNAHTLMEERFDSSAKVPLRFYISSSYFDKNSSYSVSVRWLRPTEPQPVHHHHYYIGQ
mmetsp:Transcript_34591/g.99637  ORF Transcript_34591/g.99637 Transcript_34591/m.99637 type:complete len:545 (-) Transcript_34591:186-1820(-)